MSEFNGGIKNLASETLKAWKYCHGDFEECAELWCPYYHLNEECDEDGDPIEYECLETLNNNIDAIIEHYVKLTKEMRTWFEVYPTDEDGWDGED